MKIVITDVNVFFDLFELKVLPQFFELDWEIHTTDFVFNEIVYEVFIPVMLTPCPGLS